MNFRFRSGPMGLFLMILTALSMLPSAIMGLVIFGFFMLMIFGVVR